MKPFALVIVFLFVTTARAEKEPIEQRVQAALGKFITYDSIGTSGITKKKFKSLFKKWERKECTTNTEIKGDKIIFTYFSKFDSESEYKKEEFELQVKDIETSKDKIELKLDGKRELEFKLDKEGRMTGVTLDKKHRRDLICGTPDYVGEEILGANGGAPKAPENSKAFDSRKRKDVKPEGVNAHQGSDESGGATHSAP
jgi:hypothetical protein